MVNVSVIVIFTFGIISGVRGGGDHKALVADLFRKYNINERPGEFENDTVEVRLGIQLLGLVDVNVVYGYMETNVWLHLEWNDFNLKWNPASFGGIKDFSIDARRVWKPDILLYNSVHPDFDPQMHQTNVIIKNDGNVTYTPPALLRSICSTDVAYYPFDEHKCTLQFGSWSWHGDKVTLKLQDEKGGQLSSLTGRSDWKRLGVSVNLEKTYYDCCKEPYVSVTYTVQIRRRGKATFAESTSALFLAALATLMGLFLRPHSVHRFGLALFSLFVLLAMGVLIQNRLGENVSILVSYFRTLAFIVLMTISANVAIMNIDKRNPATQKIPDWVRRIFFERILHFIRLNRSKPTSAETCRIGPISTNTSTNVVNTNLTQPDIYGIQYEELVTDLQEFIQKSKRHDDSTTNEFQFLALVLNRLALLLYIVFTFIFFISLYCQFVLF